MAAHEKNAKALVQKRAEAQAKLEEGLARAELPVDPFAFTKKVTAQLTKVGVLVSNDTPQVIGRLCRLFNYSINNPKIGGLLNRKDILVYPAETGIGKSVSIQQYAAMLPLESSLIVVNTVEEAISYCNNINTVRRQSGYARFYVSGKTGDSNQELNSDHLVNAQCLVITNSQFIKRHSSDDAELDKFKLYKSPNNTIAVPRDLVVIDERLSLLTKNSLQLSRLEGIAKFLKQIVDFSSKYKDDKSVILLQKSFDTLFKCITSKHNIRNDRATIVERLELENALETENLPIRINFHKVKRVIDLRLDEIGSEIKLLQPSGNHQLDAVKNDVDKVLQTLVDILDPIDEEIGTSHSGGEEVYGEFALYNNYLYRVKSIANRMGTAVVLDATAAINKFYQLATDHSSNIALIDAPKIRKYENLTIYKANGFRQSASSICQDSKRAALNAKMYASMINEIIEEDDKLLVISFKEFVDLHLAKHFAGNSNVVFTNWGRHVGRNEWSDCNKVMLIGWFRQSQEEYIAQMFNIASLGSSNPNILKFVVPQHIDDLKYSTIADHLVQGAMRCCARKIISKDSDCKPASIYLFQDELEGSDKVVDVFTGVFNKAKIKTWIPKVRIADSSLSSSSQKKEAVIRHLIELAKTSNSYWSSKVCEETGTNKSTLSKWLKDGNYFKKRLDELGFTIVKGGKGKSDQFKFI